MGEPDIRHLAEVFKGAGNHRRLIILLVLQRYSSLPLEGICHHAGSTLTTISEHTRRLALAGLIHKRYRGREVHHTLAPLGQRILGFLPTLLSP